VAQGDFFMDRSRGLLERHLQMLRLSDQNTIRSQYDSLVSGHPYPMID